MPKVGGGCAYPDHTLTAHRRFALVKAERPHECRRFLGSGYEREARAKDIDWKIHGVKVIPDQPELNVRSTGGSADSWVESALRQCGRVGDTIHGASSRLTVNIDHAQFSGAVTIEDTGVAGNGIVFGFNSSAGDRLLVPNNTSSAIDTI